MKAKYENWKVKFSKIKEGCLYPGSTFHGATFQIECEIKIPSKRFSAIGGGDTKYEALIDATAFLVGE